MNLEQWHEDLLILFLKQRERERESTELISTPLSLSVCMFVHIYLNILYSNVMRGVEVRKLNV